MPACSGEAAHARADDRTATVVAQRRCFREHAQRALLELALVVLEEDERAHTQLLLHEEVEDLLRAGAVVLDLPALAARRRRAEREHLGLRPGLAGVVRVDAEVRERHCLLRLGLRAHDPLQRRVARLVDRVRDGDHRRQRRLDPVVAELGLPLDGRLAVGDGQLGRLRDQRQAQPVGDGGPEDGAVRVGRLLPEEDEVGAFALERLRQHAAGGDEIGARRALVADEHGAVGAHRERLAQRVERARRGRARRRTTSASPVASFTRSASSTAFTSNAFSPASPERSSRFVAGSMRRGRAASGTSFTQTAIFTAAEH